MKLIIFIFSLTLKGTLLYRDSIPMKNYDIRVIELDSTLVPIDSSTVKTDSKGKFTFKTDKRGIFILTANYKGARFRTDPMFEDNENISFSVYDTTSQSDHLFIQRAHIAFIPSQGIIQVIEVYNFLNALKKMILKEFKIELPPNSSHLFSTQGILPFEAKMDSNVFLYNRGFTPGTKTISLLYHIPSQNIKYERKISFLINELLIMTPPELVVSSDRKLVKSKMNTPQGAYDVYTITNLRPGDILKFEVKKAGGSKLKEVIPPLILIAGFLIFIILLRRKWKKREVISE